MRRDRASSISAAPIETVEGELDLRELGRMLWRKRRWIIIPTIVTAVAAFFFVNLLTPLYRSESRVLIENRETAYNRPEADRGNAPDRTLVDAEAVQSQVQLIQSRDLARKVVYALKLNENKEFNSESGFRVVMRAILSLAGMDRGPSKTTIEERVLERFYDHLSVYQVEKSRVIGIDFQSADPQLAAQVANGIAAEYLARQQASKRDAMRQAGQWLASEIESMRGRVAEAEAKVENFRSRSDLYVGNNNNQLGTQTLGELNTQIVAARTQKADFEARARLIRAMLKSGKPIEFSEILNSDLIRRLSEQRASLRAQLAEQSSTLLPLHPRIKELHAQIASMDSQIRIEADKLVRTLENDTRVAGAKLDNMLASLDQMKKQQSALGGQDVQLRALEREAKAQRDLLESYLARYRDAAARETPGAVPPDARIVSNAVASSTPHFPKKIPIVLVASLAMAMLTTMLLAMGELLGGEVYRRAEAPLLWREPRMAAAEPVVETAVSPVRIEEAAIEESVVAETVPGEVAPGKALPEEAALEKVAAAMAALETAMPEPIMPEAIMPEAGPTPQRAGQTKQRVEPEPEPELGDELGTETSMPASSAVPAKPASVRMSVRLAELLVAMRDHGSGIFLIGRASAETPSGRIAVRLARDLAASGARVLFLDIDTETTPSAALLADMRAPGLADLLSNTVSFSEVIHRDQISRIHVISPGRGGGDSVQLLAADRLAIVLGALSQTYDYVIAAMPVLASLRGAKRLARFARGTVLVAAEGGEAAAEAQVEALADQGFANVTVISLTPETPDDTSGRFAA